MPKILEILQKVWGHTSFRPMQEEIIQSVIHGQDTLALLPTGGGKSICFQVPGIYLDGLSLVISPLIALMKDQVERLNQLGVPATYINSSLSISQIDQKLQGAMDGRYRFLYLAPERIQSEMFRLRLPKMPVKLLVVDEAHCISQWGYDFRPAYLDIALIREALTDVPVIALTASATPQVKEDILEKLQMPQARLFQKSFRRDNLRYFVVEEENIAKRILNIAQRTKGSGIIYARTRKRTVKLAEMLVNHGISASAYHGGMKTTERNSIQQAWLDNQTRIIVATNAFGMGIDKADVRFVIHFNLPFDLESYYQEAGRGGRDGKTALAIAFRTAVDMAELNRWNADKYPTWEQLGKHYEAICKYFQIAQGDQPDKTLDFHLADIAASTGEAGLSLYNSLKVLQNEGFLYLNEDSDDYGYIQVNANPEDIIIYKSYHPTFADLIDFVLRQLGGESFRNEVRFNPEYWARKIDLPPLELHHQLSRLAHHQLISYIPPSDVPGIRFLKPRQKLTKQDLNWAKYNFLRKQSDHRLKEMIRYIESTEVCRSLMIQHYFGEQAHQPCGKCDVCVGRNRTKVSDDDFKQIQAAIIDSLKQKATPYRELLLSLSTGSPAQREKVLRYLLDKKVILTSSHGRLHLPPK